MKVGDTVRLKSGSLLMTIESIEGNEVTCVWNNSKNEIERQVFIKDVLVLDDGSF